MLIDKVLLVHLDDDELLFVGLQLQREVSNVVDSQPPRVTYADAMRMNFLVDLTVLPDQLSVCDLYPLARLDLLEVRCFLAFTVPLRNLRRCVTGEEPDVKLVAIVIGSVRTSIAAAGQFLEVLLRYINGPRFVLNIVDRCLTDINTSSRSTSSSALPCQPWLSL